MYSRPGIWWLRDRSVGPFYPSELTLGFAGEDLSDNSVYTSDYYLVYEAKLFDDGGTTQEFRFSNGNLTGTIYIRREGTAVYASFNGGAERRIRMAGWGEDPVSGRVSFILPLSLGSFASLDNETAARYVGKWTASAEPKLNGPDPAEDYLVGDTPFDFFVSHFTVDDITGAYRPDITVPDSDQKLCGGANYTITAKTLGTEKRSKYSEGPLYWKAVIVPPGGGAPLRTFWGNAGMYSGEPLSFEIDWDGKTVSGESLPGDKKYGVIVSATVHINDDPEPINGRGRLWDGGFGPPEANVNPYEVHITPNPYIPYTADEIEYVIDEDGNMVWPDTDDDGVPDKFPDHDGDGIPDFEPWETPPGILFTAYPNRAGYDTTWIADVVSEDGEVLHTETSQTPNQDINFEWTPPADLEPQTLKLKVTGSQCPKSTVNVDVRAQGTGGNCRPLAFEGEVVLGNQTKLEIFASGSKPIASSLDDPDELTTDAISRLSRVNKFEGWKVRLSGLNVRDENPFTQFAINLKSKVSEKSESVTLSWVAPGTYEAPLPNDLDLLETANESKYTYYNIPHLGDNLTLAGGIHQTLLDFLEPMNLMLSDSVFPFAAPNKRLGTLSYLPEAEVGGSIPPGQALASSLNFARLGFEDVEATFTPGETVTNLSEPLQAVVKTQNKAAMVIAMVHGDDLGQLECTYLDSNGARSVDLFSPGRMAGAGKTMILAACRSLDVYDFNNRRVGEGARASSDDPPALRTKPGLDWWDKTRSGNTILLGYNYPVRIYEAKGTVEDYLVKLVQLRANGASDGEIQQLAWMAANLDRKQGSNLNACAWDQTYYYYISYQLVLAVIKDPKTGEEQEIQKYEKPKILRIPISRLQNLTTVPASYDRYPDGVPVGAERITIPGVIE